MVKSFAEGDKFFDQEDHGSISSTSSIEASDPETALVSVEANWPLETIETGVEDVDGSLSGWRPQIRKALMRAHQN